MRSTETRASSKVTSAAFLGSDTSTLATPGSADSARVTLAVQPPHVMARYVECVCLHPLAVLLFLRFLVQRM
jgi:hypothetical protein